MYCSTKAITIPLVLCTQEHAAGNGREQSVTARMASRRCLHVCRYSENGDKGDACTSALYSPRKRKRQRARVAEFLVCSQWGGGPPSWLGLRQAPRPAPAPRGPSSCNATAVYGVEHASAPTLAGPIGTPTSCLKVRAHVMFCARPRLHVCRALFTVRSTGLTSTPAGCWGLPAPAARRSLGVRLRGKSKGPLSLSRRLARWCSRGSPAAGRWRASPSRRARTPSPSLPCRPLAWRDRRRPLGRIPLHVRPRETAGTLRPWHPHPAEPRRRACGALVVVYRRAAPLVPVGIRSLKTRRRGFFFVDGQ